MDEYLVYEDMLLDAVFSPWNQTYREHQANLEEAILEGDSLTFSSELEALNPQSTTEPATVILWIIFLATAIWGASRFLKPDETLLANQPMPLLLKNGVEQLKKALGISAFGKISDSLQDTKRAFDQNKLSKEALKAFLNETLPKEGRSSMQWNTSVQTNRLVSYGFLAEALRWNVQTYQLIATIDEKTTAFCRSIHGREYTITSAVDHLRRIFETNDPYQTKRNFPWPKSLDEPEIQALSNEDMIRRGWHVPPFHTLCRTRMVLTSNQTFQEVTSVTPTDLTNLKYE